MIKTLARIVVGGAYVLAILALVGLLTCNLRLYVPNPPDPSSKRVAEEVWAELRFLRHALDRGAGKDMQQLFPEGDFFSHVLYGLAWVNVGLQSAPGSPERQQALSEARWTWETLGTPDLLRPFVRARTLSPAYGVFYTGWRNYLLAGILLLQAPAQLDAQELAIFEEQCDQIARALEANPTPFLQAYPGASWPVDTFPALVSLQTHTQLVDDRYEPVIEAWVESLHEHLDPRAGLLPHLVDYRTGRQIQGARATSQVLILRFLLDIDPDFGIAQYQAFRARYVVYLWGLPGVLEYPQGVYGQTGDVDSGPLIKGVSLSATAIMLGTSRVYGDVTVSDAIWHAGEFLGFPVRYGGMKRYWLGQMPVGDAFAVWSKTAVPWLESIPRRTYHPIIPWWWRIPLNGLSLGIGIVIVLMVRGIERAICHWKSE
jgi:hypothetical protein